MKFTTYASALVLGALMPLVSADCSSICSHNNDAGRWVDSNSPAGEVDNLVNGGGGCYTATGQGTMCLQITGSGGDAGTVGSCLEEVAADWQSYHSDWFLWTAITCTSGSAVGTITIT